MSDDDAVDLDLAAAVALVVAFALLVAVDAGRSVRLAVGVPALLVGPGYAVVAALYPAVGRDGQRATADDALALGNVERLALTVVASVAAVALVALAADATPWGIHTAPIAGGVSAVTAVAAGAAAGRRRRLGVAAPAWRRHLAGHRPRRTATGAMSVVLVLAVVVAGAVVVTTATDPGAGEQFTEVALLAQNDTGALVAGGYPTEYTVGESRSVYLDVGNHEGRRSEYTAVVLLQTVDGGEPTTVAELDRRQFAVPAGTDRAVALPVTPTESGDPLRVAVLLYRGDAPEDPSSDGALHALHLWVTVAPAS